MIDASFEQTLLVDDTHTFTKIVSVTFPGLNDADNCEAEITDVGLVLLLGGLSQRYLTSLPAAKRLPNMVKVRAVLSAGTDARDKELISGVAGAGAVTVIDASFEQTLLVDETHTFTKIVSVTAPGLNDAESCEEEITDAGFVLLLGGLSQRYLTSLPAAKLLPNMVKVRGVESAGTDARDKELMLGVGGAEAGAVTVIDASKVVG